MLMSALAIPNVNMAVRIPLVHTDANAPKDTLVITSITNVLVRIAV